MKSRREFLARTLCIAAWAGCTRRAGQPAASSRRVRRIVSLSPATTEALFGIGAGPLVMGRSRFCDYPPEALALPVVGGFVDADLEAILELEPELVVGAPNPNSIRLRDKLAPRGIDTWFPTIDSVASIETMITGLGQRTSHAGESVAVASSIEDRARAVARAVAGESSPRVLMVLGSAPVVAAGPRSFLSDLIDRANAVNVVTSGAPWQTIELERLIDLDPDILLDASDPAHTIADLASPAWHQVRAVRTGRVIAMSDSRVLRPGPRVAEGLAVMARALHPGVVTAIP